MVIQSGKALSEIGAGDDVDLIASKGQGKPQRLYGKVGGEVGPNQRMFDVNRFVDLSSTQWTVPKAMVLQGYNFWEMVTDACPLWLFCLTLSEKNGAAEKREFDHLSFHLSVRCNFRGSHRAILLMEKSCTAWDV